MGSKDIFPPQLPPLIVSEVGSTNLSKGSKSSRFAFREAAWNGGKPVKRHGGKNDVFWGKVGWSDIGSSLAGFFKHGFLGAEKPGCEQLPLSVRKDDISGG